MPAVFAVVYSIIARLAARSSIVRGNCQARDTRAPDRSSSIVVAVSNSGVNWSSNISASRSMPAFKPGQSVTLFSNTPSTHTLRPSSSEVLNCAPVRKPWRRPMAAVPIF